MQLPDFLSQDKYGWIHITGHRIGLTDVVFWYREGDSPEMLHARFPTVPVPLFYKVIGFYLENQAEADAYVNHSLAESERQRASAPNHGPSLEELKRRREAQRLAPGA
jgi:uncharacterized protein (DUF433 family)